MIDPATALMAATGAFNAIRKGCQIGRDLEQMGGDLSRWSKAIADFDYAAKKVENPSWVKMLGGSVEAQSMELFVQRRQKEKMRDELRTWISGTLGPSHWESLLKIESEVRQAQREFEHAKMERRERRIEWLAGFALFVVLVGGLFALVWLMINV